jgi:hypothetical protein
MTKRYKLVVNETIKLMEAMLQEFAENGRLSLEGVLKYLNLKRLHNISRWPDGALRRNSSESTDDFVIIPLDSATVQFLIKSVLPSVGIRRRIVHVQIEQNGRLVFGAYDWFHPECVWVKVSEEILKNLKEGGILRSYTAFSMYYPSDDT